jgi:membrane-associated protein
VEAKEAMEVIRTVMDFVLHFDKHLAEIIQAYGPLTYLILFAIIFAETGLVIFPFLPGDSLLFAAGALSAFGSLSLSWLLGVLIVASILGDTVNYWIGKTIGQKLVDNPRVPFINQEHIDKTEAFYKKHGGKTIILARFVPIIRTFAPFVAGVGKMHYSTFLLYNVVGGVTWVSIFTLAGYLFGNIPFIHDNFELAVVAIILISVLPIAYEYIKHRNSPSLRQKTLEKVVNE